MTSFLINQLKSFGIQVNSKEMDHYIQSEFKESIPNFPLLQQTLLDMDFRQQKRLFESFLTTGTTKLTPDPTKLPLDYPNSFSGPVVLQVVSLHNIAQPLKRRNDDSCSDNRLLQIQLTDGHSKITAMVIMTIVIIIITIGVVSNS